MASQKKPAPRIVAPDNPFDVPPEKSDKNTADEELSPKTGGENSSLGKQN